MSARRPTRTKSKLGARFYVATTYSTTTVIVSITYKDRVSEFFRAVLTFGGRLTNRGNETANV